MSDSENVCVGCKHPIVDESIEGDMTLKEYDVRIDSKEMAVGVDSKCRNCAVILDAIVTFLGREDRPFMPNKTSVFPNERKQELVINIGRRFEVMRSSDPPRSSKPFTFDAWNFKRFRPLSEDTSSQDTMRMIQEWKTICIQNHEQCMQRAEVPLPKRILEITADHVLLREQPGSVAPYACLSHCWGLDGLAVKLTAATVGHLRDGIKTSDLPTTFRDAVEVCRYLGIYYIWIDALCIFQDSEEDWKEAAATMGDIYENSHITIAATASRDSNGGLFSSDRPVTKRLEKHPHLYVRTALRKFPTSTQSTTPKSMPLLTRGWVYQERRLSHRTIHFGKHQVYWECQTGFLSEDSREDTMWDTSVAYFTDSYVSDWGDRCVDPKNYWQKIVTEYTALQLTYESDLLPAIAAVVDRMSRLQRVDDVYIAGLWKSSILSDLLWSTQDNKPRPSRVAPSWSWVSAQNSVIFWDDFEFTEQVKIVTLDYTIVGPANLGEVTNASIILTVPVLNLTGFDELDAAEKGERRWSTRFKDITKSAPVMEQFRQNNLEISNTWFYPDYDLTTANPPFKCGCIIKLLVARDSDADMGGIVIQQTSKNPPEYKRIGFLGVGVIMTKSEMVGEKEEDLVRSDYDGEEKARVRKGEYMGRLIMSLPMEEVKIV